MNKNLKEWELTYAIIKRDLKNLKLDVPDHPDNVKILKNYSEGIEQIIKELMEEVK